MGWCGVSPCLFSEVFTSQHVIANVGMVPVAPELVTHSVVFNTMAELELDQKMCFDPNKGTKPPLQVETAHNVVDSLVSIQKVNRSAILKHVGDSGSEIDVNEVYLEDEMRVFEGPFLMLWK